jgi:hypothetical protein
MSSWYKTVKNETLKNIAVGIVAIVYKDFINCDQEYWSLPNIHDWPTVKNKYVEIVYKKINDFLLTNNIKWSSSLIKSISEAIIIVNPKNIGSNVNLFEELVKVVLIEISYTDETGLPKENE